MLVHPQFDPVMFHVAGPLSANWYGFMYLLAFLAVYLLASYRSKRLDGWHPDMIVDMLFYAAMGVMLGGRFGYVFFYQFDKLLADPTYLFKAWEGGMSFHGGFIGVLIAMWLVSRKYKKTPFQVLDFIAPVVPLGLFFGRTGNFINGELWGRVSEGGYSWLMAFPQAQYFDAQLLQKSPELMKLATEVNGAMLLPRHPSQVYEAIAEGLVLFVVLWWFTSKPRPRYAASAIFLMGYGIARFMIEFVRQPDYDQTFRLFGFMTKGQYLTAPMIIIGVLMFMYAYKKKIYD